MHTEASNQSKLRLSVPGDLNFMRVSNPKTSDLFLSLYIDGETKLSAWSSTLPPQGESVFARPVLQSRLFVFPKVNQLGHVEEIQRR